MERAATQPAQNDRTRYLNIVYFVESARSHTIRINLKYARWAIGAALVVCAWAAGSVFWIASLRWQIQETRERLETSLTTIFDYQIKNDKVFELAYPSEATKSYYSEAAQLASNNPVLDSKTQPLANEDHSLAKQPLQTVQVESQTTNPQKAINQVPIDKTAVKSADPVSTHTFGAKVATNSTSAQTSTATTASNAASTDKDTVNTVIEVSGAKISKIGNKLELVFDIHNPHSERAAGYIWAVAAFATPDGKTMHVGAPSHLQLEVDSGKVKAFKTGYRFSIQRYKKKDFEFKTPSAKDWKLTKMTIHFSDLTRKNEQAVNVPVDQLASAQSSEMPVSNETNL